MEEPVRLACPHCELVYRLKKIIPGKKYACKNCGGTLMPPEAIGDDHGAPVPVAAPRRPDAVPAPESDLSRLPKIIEQLTQRLDVIKELEDADEGSVAKLVEINHNLESGVAELQRQLEEKLTALDDRLVGIAAESAGVESLRAHIEQLTGNIEKELSGKSAHLDNRVDALDVKVAETIDTRIRDLDREMRRRIDEVRETVKGVSESLSGFVKNAKIVSPEAIDALRRDVVNGQDSIFHRLGEQFASQQHDIAQLLTAPESDGNTVEVDIDELADRLVAGVRSHTALLEPEDNTAVDAMARLAETLIKEQSTNSARLDNLAAEIHNAAASLSRLDGWENALPERVADEIGQTVEARVIGPISGALARQAPAILSELQDSKLVDIVSRSVREAQRPLLREILSGGRAGVPVWLFASVLLPLLLILGYLFLPGEVGPGEGYSGETAETLARIEGNTSVALDNEDRLRTIEDAVLDIHSEALAHVKNAARLEEEVKNLKATLAERDRLIKDYNDTLQTQVKRLRDYEMRLVQLGVSPKGVGE